MAWALTVSGATAPQNGITSGGLDRRYYGRRGSVALNRDELAFDVCIDAVYAWDLVQRSRYLFNARLAAQWHVERGLEGGHARVCHRNRMIVASSDCRASFMNRLSSCRRTLKHTSLE